MAALIAPSLAAPDERHEQVGGIDVLVDVVDDTQPLLIGGSFDGRGVTIVGTITNEAVF